MEVRKQVVGYEGYYLVSNLGKVKSLERIVDRGKYGTQLYPSKVLKQFVRTRSTNNTPYIAVNLSVNGVMKTTNVHRIVAEAFIENPQGKLTVNHKDGDGTNNNVNNLEWNTYSENLKHSFRELGRKPVNSMVGKFDWRHHGSVSVLKLAGDGSIICKYNSFAQAERENKTSRSSIRKVCLGRQEYAAGYKWRYETPKR